MNPQAVFHDTRGIECEQVDSGAVLVGSSTPSFSSEPVTNKQYALTVPVLPERRSVDGSCVLVGDAANTMSPFLSQGLSLDLEDAGTLGCLLGHVRSRSQLPAATALYAKIGNARAQSMRDETDVFERQLQASARGCLGGEEDSAPGTDFCSKIEYDSCP